MINMLQLNKFSQYIFFISSFLIVYRCMLTENFLFPPSFILLLNNCVGYLARVKFFLCYKIILYDFASLYFNRIMTTLTLSIFKTTRISDIHTSHMRKY